MKLVENNRYIFFLKILYMFRYVLTFPGTTLKNPTKAGVGCKSEHMLSRRTIEFIQRF